MRLRSKCKIIAVFVPAIVFIGESGQAADSLAEKLPKLLTELRSCQDDSKNIQVKIVELNHTIEVNLKVKKLIDDVTSYQQKIGESVKAIAASRGLTKGYRAGIEDTYANYKAIPDVLARMNRERTDPLEFYTSADTQVILTNLNSRLLRIEKRKQGTEDCQYKDLSCGNASGEVECDRGSYLAGVELGPGKPLSELCQDGVQRMATKVAIRCCRLSNE